MKSLRNGFTLTEVVVGSSIMLIVVMVTLTLYTESNKIAADQYQFSDIQNSVRSAIYFISKDIANAGVGLSTFNSGYAIEGVDGYSPSPGAPDSIKLLGNYENPLSLRIETYQGGAGGAAATAFLYDGELDNSPYLAEFYENKLILLVSTTCPGCFAYRSITHMFGVGEVGVEKFVMAPGLAEFNPPGGLVDTGCPVDCWLDAVVTFGQVKQYWLDSTGIPEDYPGLNLSLGVDGYLGIASTLYKTTMDEVGNVLHMPIAQDIENLQFQYVGDLDYDGSMDASVDWDNNNWTIEPSEDMALKLGKLDLISRIRGIRIWVLGKTANPFVGVSGTPSTNIHLYRRPAIANSPMSDQDDRHRRFLVETTSNIRNHSLDFYSTYIALEDATLKVTQIRRVE